MYQKFIKRFLDIFFSLLLLILLSPVILVTAVLVRIKLGSPVIFKQSRIGFKGKAFMIYKFRSMTNAKDENGNLLPDKDRLTKFGKTLRSLSLDEFPQLVNILKGEMSFVGPRPLLADFLPMYTERQMHRHDVRPGLTGLAQVNGRNLVNLKDRCEFDLEYVSKITFINDLKIVIKTFFVVFKKTGVYYTSDKAVTIKDFQ